MLADTDIGSGTLRFAKDYIGVDYHNDGHSHIDALCHVAFDGVLYNGRAVDSVTSAGSAANTIEGVKHGLVGRGVLLDVPRLRGLPWLEPGEHIFREDLESAEREQGVTVARGDILLVRTGHSRRLAGTSLGPTNAKAGLHPTVARVARRAAHRRARLGRQQRHGAEQHRGDRVPDPRAGAQRDGRPSARLPPVRGSRRRLRARRTAGSSCSPRHRCGSLAGPARRSTRRRSSEPGSSAFARRAIAFGRLRHSRLPSRSRLQGTITRREATDCASVRGARIGRPSRG